MAHGRKRCFAGGLLAGILGASLIITGGAWVLRQELYQLAYPSSHPAFEREVISITSDWARLPALSAKARGLHCAAEGGMFTRSFRLSFYGEPKMIQQWVKSCPGLVDPKCTREQAGDGSQPFRYPAGGGAMSAELRHYPEQGIVEIYTYWS